MEAASGIGGSLFRVGAAACREQRLRGQCEKNQKFWKQISLFLGIQRQRLAAKVQPGEARFGPELDWEKPWRDQVFGDKMSETNGNKLLFF